jgi:hypothetical protein
MLPEQYKSFSRPTVQAVKEQTEHFINGCKIYGRNCVKSRWVRGHIESFRGDVRRTAIFRVVQTA